MGTGWEHPGVQDCCIKWVNGSQYLVAAPGDQGGTTAGNGNHCLLRRLPGHCRSQVVFNSAIVIAIASVGIHGTVIKIQGQDFTECSVAASG